MVLLVITILLTVGYTWLILFYYNAWKQVPTFTPRNTTPETKITIVISSEK
jgi:cytoskeletal protein RodZ